MPDQPTPGQVAYEAYWAADEDAARFAAIPCPWQALRREDRRAWEAAAQAVWALAHPQAGLHHPIEAAGWVYPPVQEEETRDA